MRQKTILYRWMQLPLCLGVTAFIGCSTVRPPDENVAKAELAVREANQTKAQQYSPLELQLARDNLEKARRAMKDEDYVQARRLADKALVDAQLAETKASTEEAKRVANELRESLETLRREINRETVGG